MGTVGRQYRIERPLTKPYPCRTHGQAGRMNRKAATVKAFPDFEALKAHVLAFVTAFNFAQRLKAPP